MPRLHRSPVTATPLVSNTRPSNRRDLILQAAGVLFVQRGYPDVSMKDIADQVAVGPSALYRHYANKQVLLGAVVSSALNSVEQQLMECTTSASSDTPYDRVASVFIEHNAIGVLWHREARYLLPSTHADIKNQLRRIREQLSDFIAADRPDLSDLQGDLLGWAVLGAGTSIAFHKTPTQPAALGAIMKSVASAHVPVLQGRGLNPDRDSPWFVSRRESILRLSTRMFASRGYNEVSLEDIGEQVGIAGPSVYNHFQTKAEILETAINRGNELLQADMYRELSRARNARDALRRLCASYCEFAFYNQDLIQILTSDIDHLPGDKLHAARAAQYFYIDQWVDLMMEVHPHQRRDDARVSVQAALSVVNDVANTPHLRVPGIDDALRAIATDILLIGPE